MKRKQLLQTLFALCASALFNTGCSNDETTSADNAESSSKTSVVFNLGLPPGDEVNYTRAAVADDESEWSIKTMKVYHFTTAQTTSPTDADYSLVTTYNLPVTTADLPATVPGTGQCLSYGDGEYQLRISLRTNSVGENTRHKFIVVTNDVSAAFDQAITDASNIADIKLSSLRTAIADKQLTAASNSTDLFMGDDGGLCMTGETGDLPLARAHNDFSSDQGKTITLTRIMSRLDVKSFVSASKVFVLKSVILKYSNNYMAPKGYLFAPKAFTVDNNIWYDTTQQGMEVTQNSKYNTIGYPDYDSYTSEPDWVAQTSKTVTLEGGGTVVRNGTWYKKVLYMYPFPIAIGNLNTETPKLVITYSLNGTEGTKEIAMKDEITKLPFDIKRNYVYTLQVGDPSASSEELSFSFIVSAWNLHTMDADLNEGTTVTP